jgi:hypothetical protein
MATLITDEMLDAFAVEAPLDGLAAALSGRYGGILDRLAPYLPLDARADRRQIQALASALRGRI